jgi:alkylation response protein AidB-like acyl-CoA dehydrogenase
MVDVLGSDALVARPDGSLHPMVRSFLSSRAETIYGGTVEVQRNILGERVLGLPK